MGRNGCRYISVALLLGACSSEPSMPVLYAGGAGGSSAAGAAGSAGTGGAAGGGSTLSPKARCIRPDGWPTLDTVLGMAELVPDAGSVSRMVMTTRGLFWLGDGELHRLGANGRPVLVATTEAWGSTELEASSSAVVWLWGGSIWALSLDAGATAVELGTDINITGNPLLVDETHVYYEPAFTTPGGLRRIPLTGGSPEIVQTAARDVFAVHDGYAYYRQSYAIGADLLRRAPLAGGAAEQINDQISLFAVGETVFDGNIMYASTSSIYGIDVGTANSWTNVFSLAPFPQQGADNYLTSLALTGERLVYADGLGTVGWVTTSGSQCANIMVDPDKGRASPGGPPKVAVDDEHLYLLVSSGPSGAGSLHRIARAKVGL